MRSTTTPHDGAQTAENPRCRGADRKPAARRSPDAACGQSATLWHESNREGRATVVIVAAGNGSRLRHGRSSPPKPLFKLAGLRLIERVILTLKSRGIDSFRIVVGYRADEVVSALRQSRALRRQDVDVEFVHCPGFQKGNGHSLARGAKGIDGPLLLAMSDHVIDPKQVEALLDAAKKQPDRALLVTDPEPGRIFDLSDATKVRANPDHVITAIGKDLEDYGAIDTGLFYFPAGASSVIDEVMDGGGTSISDVARRYIELGLFSAVPVEGARWQDVDNEAMAARAEAMLLGSLEKPTDGFVSRRLNRKISIPVSAFLARLGVTPNMVTASVLVMGLAAAACAFFPETWWIAALLFQLASVLDGSDGEIARLTWSGSKAGAWFDSISDAVRYTLFYASLGAGLAYTTGSIACAAATMAFVVLSVASVVSMTARLRRMPGAPRFVTLGREMTEVPEGRKPLWQRLSLRLLPLFKLDFLALLTMALLLVGLGPVVFGISLLAAALMAANVLHHVKSGDLAAGKDFMRGRLPGWGKTLACIAGLAIFALALSSVSWSDVREALVRGGWRVLPVFLVPLGWLLANTAGLHVLLGGRVSLGTLLYNRIVGEALNATIPMANLGGEPFKVFHLSRLVGVERALAAVVSDKVIAIGAGLLFSGAVLVAGGGFATALPPGLPAVLVSAGVVSLAAGTIPILALVSPVVRRAFAAVLLRFGLCPGKIPNLRIPELAGALAWQLVGRTLLIVEFAGLLWVLTGRLPDAPTLLVLTGLAGALGLLFFMIPQGLGVNEAGITGIMMLLGYGESLGMAVALLRRGRMVLWAAAGLGLFALVQGLSLLRRLHASLAPTRGGA